MKITPEKRKPAARSQVVNVMTYLLVLQVLGGCAGYVPGRQSYWDTQIVEMCKKDGGVTIYERIPISKDRFQRLQRSGRYVGISPKELVSDVDIVYYDRVETILRDGNPRVRRLEQIVRRKDNNIVVARMVSYARTGGDIPSPAHESSYRCPSEEVLLSDLEKIFAIEGGRE